MRIAVIPGDGIGQEVTAEAVKALDTVADGLRLGRSTSSSFPGARTTTWRRASRSRRTAMRRSGEFDAILLGAMGDPRVAGQSARPRHSPRHAIRAGPVRQLPSRAAAGRSAVSAEGSRPRRRELRRVPGEHRGSLRRRGRAVQAGHARRDCGAGGDQHLQGRLPHHPPRVRVRPDPRPAKGVHGRQEQCHAAGARAVAACLQGNLRRVSRTSRPAISTSTRSRCCS